MDYHTSRMDFAERVMFGSRKIKVGVKLEIDVHAVIQKCRIDHVLVRVREDTVAYCQIKNTWR